MNSRGRSRLPCSETNSSSPSVSRDPSKCRSRRAAGSTPRITAGARRDQTATRPAARHSATKTARTSKSGASPDSASRRGSVEKRPGPMTGPTSATQSTLERGLAGSRASFTHAGSSTWQSLTHERICSSAHGRSGFRTSSVSLSMRSVRSAPPERGLVNQKPVSTHRPRRSGRSSMRAYSQATCTRHGRSIGRSTRSRRARLGTTRSTGTAS
jgi:hypothetical protein